MVNQYSRTAKSLKAVWSSLGNIYKEPKGNDQDPEDHLANLEYTPNEKYEGMSRPIDEIDVKEQINQLDNGTSPGLDGLNKEGIQNMNVERLVRWFNAQLQDPIGRDQEGR